MIIYEFWMFGRLHAGNEVRSLDLAWHKLCGPYPGATANWPFVIIHWPIDRLITKMVPDVALGIGKQMTRMPWSLQA